MTKTLRCAVIGAGAISTEHFNSLALCPRASAVAIAEPNRKRAREAADRFDVPRVYSNHKRLLADPDIDAVIIAVPNYLHAPIAIDALKAGKHVLLEKPMAMHARQAAAIIDAAKKSGRVFMVGMNFRFHVQTQLARQAIQRGQLGDVYHARCFYLRRAGIPRIGSWFTQKQYSGGGCTLDIGVHMLDASLHLMNDFNVATVAAHTHSRLGPQQLGDGTWGKSGIDPRFPFTVEDYCSALIRLKSGRSVQFEMSWAAFHSPEQREMGIDLLGTRGGLSLFPARVSRNQGGGYETLILDKKRLPQPEDRVHHFVNCILDRKPTFVPPSESLMVQKILDAIYASAKTGREVRLSRS